MNERSLNSWVKHLIGRVQMEVYIYLKIEMSSNKFLPSFVHDRFNHLHDHFTTFGFSDKISHCKYIILY